MSAWQQQAAVSAVAAGGEHLDRRRWVILFLAWASFLISFVDRLAWGNVSIPVGGALGMPVAALGVFVTAFYAGYVAANAFGGFGSDWLGPRVMLTFAIIPLGICTFLFSFTTSVAMGLVLQALMGLAAGADYSACVKLIASWFEKRSRGFAMGLLLTASSLGVVVTNALVPTALQFLSWSAVYQILGAVTVAIGIACYVVLRDAPSGAEMGGSAPLDLKLLFGNRDLIFLAIAGFGAFWGTWGFAFWANALMIRGHGLSPVSTGFIVALVGAGAIIGKPVIGFLSDWFGGVRKLPIIICLSSFVAMLLLFGVLSSELEFRIAAPFLGVAAFIYSPLMGAMVAEVAGVERAGAATGVTAALWQLGSVTVPVVVGLVFQETSSFYMAFVTLAAGPFIGALCMLFVQERRETGWPARP
ncbi:Sugar phosphate permease [Rhizobiales bacterium GAS191]|nr:Sugar phosphate permease [Rhizobiales bacterium GAS113]SEE32067.1 Sugar phosphate permease [Rhizobiales bacterium GAS191]